MRFSPKLINDPVVVAEASLEYDRRKTIGIGHSISLRVIAKKYKIPVYTLWNFRRGMKKL